jgi:2-hydroxy-3-oxopropionate reductase
MLISCLSICVSKIKGGGKTMNAFKNIGFIGLGIMGKPMAKNLMKAGFGLIVYDIVDSAMEELVSLGAEKANSPREAASRSDGLVITMLPNSPHVKEAVCGENGILKGARPGTIIADTSSISPVAALEISEKAKEAGVSYLDCPVSGGEPKAIDATLAFMVGGDEKDFGKIKDILLKMGSSAILVGGVSAGSIAKIANQIIVAMNIAALGEAFTLASKLNVDPEKVFEAIKGGLAGSTVMNAKMPMILNGNFKPGFRIELHIKDLKNAMEAAQSGDVAIPLTKEILSFMEQLNAEGKGKNDHSGLVEYYEKLSGVKVRKQ